MRRILSFAALSLLAISSTASAQRSTSRAASVDNNPPVELGVDARLLTTLSGNPKVTTFQLPIQQIRAGFFLSPTVSLEPTFGIATASGGGFSMTDYDIGAGMLFHFSPNRADNQVYVRPFINFNGSSATGAPSDNTFSFGGGLGVKMPIANRFASRFEVNFDHFNSHNTVPSRNALGLLAGISVYTH